MDNNYNDTHYQTASQMLGMAAESGYGLCSLLFSQGDLLDRAIQDESDPAPYTDESFQTLLDCNSRVTGLLQAAAAYDTALTRHINQCIMLS
ncbi:hypothetical protein AGMMS49992_22910 [Clostridia bacterium]|nr:hypothetical protein AGMMS49992_22910 [Clostridia bacterium]